jgi:Uma2 family endonuclease
MSTLEKNSWTSADLELFPDNGNRYEIIDGELIVTRAPSWKHQKAANNICVELTLWSRKTGLGSAVPAPGVIFADADNVIPDVVWISKASLAAVLDEAGHLQGAPELVVEVLSPGEENNRRDRQLKLKLYSGQGVREYWILDLYQEKVEIYRRENGGLALAMTLFSEDNLTTPLLPEFTILVGSLF